MHKAAPKEDPSGYTTQQSDEDPSGYTTQHKSSPPKMITLGGFIMITSAALLSIRTFPAQALLGWQSVAFNIAAVILYLLPAAFVAAELASAWPDEGGVYVWVKEAFGERWGFTAIWIQWFQMTIGFIAILAFIGGSVAYVFAPDIAENKLYIFLVILAVWWGATAVNLKGIKAYERMTTWFTALGVYLPFVLLILGAIVYFARGGVLQIPLVPHGSADLIPHISGLSAMSLLVTYVFFFIGIEMTAAHVNHLEKPGRNYPIAILSISVIMTAISILGSLIVAWLVPAKKMSLNAGVMQAVAIAYGVSSPLLVKTIGLCVAIGATGQVVAWVLGPVRGLAVTAEHGSLPPILQKRNSEGMPVGLLIAQGLFVTFWGLVFLLYPGGLNSSFWALFALTTTVYIVMYFLMYAAAIKLRYTQPNRPRAFRVPGGKTGMWVVAGWGFISMVFVFLVALLPPDQVKGDAPIFITFMLAGTAAVVAIPLGIYAKRRANWKPSAKDERISSTQIAQTTIGD